MPKKLTLIFLLAFSFLGLSCPQAQEVPLGGRPQFAVLEPLARGDRVLILAPHPDDEAIGCAGVIQSALAAGVPVHVVYLTQGDHNQISFIVYEKRLTLRSGEFIHMGQVRRKEAIRAMRLLGLGEDNLVFLGYPDFGTFTMFRNFWQSKKPFKSWLTRISKVPYKENFSYANTYVPENILKDLKATLLQYRPNKIFVSHPADVNVDHKALYLFLKVALSDLKNDLPEAKVYPYLVHSVGWPLPRHYHPELPLLPPRKFLDSPINWRIFGLEGQRLANKHQAILAYKSQTQVSAFYLLSFARKNELFGDYPEIDLFESPSAFVSQDLETSGEDDVDKTQTGKNRVGYGINQDAFVIRLDLPDNTKKRLGAVMDLFGYSGKTAFPQMPKLRIIIRRRQIKIFDGSKKIKPEGVNIMETSAGKFDLTVPYKIMGDPDFVLLAMKVYSGPTYVYGCGFHKINLRRPQDAGIKSGENKKARRD